MSDGDRTKHRLFLALWPDDETRSRLASAARALTRHPVPDGNLHMTLHFLGACTAEQQRCYIEAASAITCQEFEINIDSVGGRSRTGLLWLGASRCPPVLDRLVAELGEVLQICGYEPEQRRFLPHVTVSRKQKRRPAGIDPPVLSWRVRGFALVESVAVEGGVRYEVRARWACGG